MWRNNLLLKTSTAIIMVTHGVHDDATSPALFFDTLPHSTRWVGAGLCEAGTLPSAPALTPRETPITTSLLEQCFQDTAQSITSSGNEFSFSFTFVGIYIIFFILVIPCPASPVSPKDESSNDGIISKNQPRKNTFFLSLSWSLFCFCISENRERNQ